MLLEECKYFAKEKKMPEYITNNIKISCDGREDFDEENFLEQN